MSRNGRCPPHRWRMETPHGATIKGTCRWCGARRRDPASPEDRSDIASYRIENFKDQTLREAKEGNMKTLGRVLKGRLA